MIPDLKKLPREIRLYLAPSPKIESRDPKIRELAKTVGGDKDKAWDKVEAIYDWVREKVKYQTSPLKGALAALKDGKADCEDLTSLFIAICRASGIPARTVWVPGHCYPEFYLDDDKGQGHWFPCQVGGDQGVRRHYGAAADFAKRRQLPPAQKQPGTAALHGRVSDRQAHARRRKAAGEVHPRGGGEVTWNAGGGLATRIATTSPRVATRGLNDAGDSWRRCTLLSFRTFIVPAPLPYPSALLGMIQNVLVHVQLVLPVANRLKLSAFGPKFRFPTVLSRPVPSVRFRQAGPHPLPPAVSGREYERAGRRLTRTAPAPPVPGIARATPSR